MSQTVGEVVREYFPDADDDDIEFIAWEKTGWPEFWNIPEDGNTPEECFRKQLQEFRDECRAYSTLLEVGEVALGQGL